VHVSRHRQNHINITSMITIAIVIIVAIIIITTAVTIAVAQSMSSTWLNSPIKSSVARRTAFDSWPAFHLRI